jgi:hypothetical protein
VIRGSTASQAAEEGPTAFVIPSEARNLSFFIVQLIRGQIPRFARNDKINYFPSSLISLWILPGTDDWSKSAPSDFEFTNLKSQI